jgi:hypothetical protein
MAFSMFPRLHHLTYDPWIWLKVTSMASTASNIKSAKNQYKNGFFMNPPTLIAQVGSFGC